MNTKYGRHLGRRGEYTPQPQIQPGLNTSLLYRAPLAGKAVAGQVCSGWAGSLRIDPGAGGIATGTVLAQFPLTSQIPTITDALAAPVDVRMAPGHYQISLMCNAATYTSTADRPVGFRFARAGDYSGVGVLGPGGVPMATILMAGGGTTTGDFAQFEAYMPEPWFMWVTSDGNTAWVDTTLMLIRGIFAPIHLLDDNATAF